MMVMYERKVQFSLFKGTKEPGAKHYHWRRQSKLSFPLAEAAEHWMGQMTGFVARGGGDDGTVLGLGAVKELKVVMVRNDKTYTSPEESKTNGI